MAKSGKGSSGAPKSGATNSKAGWPAKTGNKSGGARTTNPPSKKGK